MILYFFCFLSCVHTVCAYVFAGWMKSTGVCVYNCIEFCLLTCLFSLKRVDEWMDGYYCTRFESRGHDFQTDG